MTENQTLMACVGCGLDVCPTCDQCACVQGEQDCPNVEQHVRTDEN